MFAAPHSLKADRQPNPQVAFGFGPHRCPGASVVRIEIAVALQALLETLAEIRPNPSQPAASDPNPNIGGYTSLPLPLRLIPDPGKESRRPAAAGARVRRRAATPWAEQTLACYDPTAGKHRLRLPSTNRAEHATQRPVAARGARRQPDGALGEEWRPL